MADLLSEMGTSLGSREIGRLFTFTGVGRVVWGSNPFFVDHEVHCEMALCIPSFAKEGLVYLSFLWSSGLVRLEEYAPQDALSPRSVLPSP